MAETLTLDNPRQLHAGTYALKVMGDVRQTLAALKLWGSAIDDPPDYLIVEPVPPSENHKLCVVRWRNETKGWSVFGNRRDQTMISLPCHPDSELAPLVEVQALDNGRWGCIDGAKIEGLHRVVGVQRVIA